MDLPPSKGFDTIFIVVDRFTNMTPFLPCVKSTSSQETTDIIMREVFQHHGILDDIISNRVNLSLLEVPMGRPQNILQNLFSLSSTK